MVDGGAWGAAVCAYAWVDNRAKPNTNGAEPVLSVAILTCFFTSLLPFLPRLTAKLGAFELNFLAYVRRTSLSASGGACF